MSDNVTKTQRFWDWFYNARVPSIYVSWGLLALEVFTIGVSIWRDSYGIWFWVIVVLSLWTLADIVRYYIKQSNPVPVMEECDHSEDQ